MYSWFKKITNWMVQLFKWILSAKYGFFIFLSYPSVVFLCWIYISDLEAIIRISGMLFQLLGLFTIIMGFIGTKKLFGTIGVFQKIFFWINNFPKFDEDNTNVIVGNANAKLSCITGSAYGGSSCPKDATLEERIVFLEKKLENTNQQIYQITENFKKQNKDIKKEMEAERNLRVNGDEDSNNLIEEAISSNLFVEEVGILWLFFGVVMASSSVEISALFI